MRTLTIPKKSELIRWGAIIAGLIVILMVVRGCQGLFSYLRQRIETMDQQVTQAEVLISHTSKLEPAKLNQEREELNARLESPLQIPAVLEEMGRLGEQHSIYIRSVEPSFEEGKETVTVKMELEGSFQALGKFLGALGKMEMALTRVRSLDLKSPDPTSPLALSLTLEIYQFKEGTA